MKWSVDLVRDRYQSKSGYVIIAEEEAETYEGEKVESLFYYDADMDGFTGLASPIEHPLLDGLVIYKDANKAMEVLDDCYSGSVSDRLSTHIVRLSDLFELYEKVANEANEIDKKKELDDLLNYADHCFYSNGRSEKSANMARQFCLGYSLALFNNEVITKKQYDENQDAIAKWVLGKLSEIEPSKSEK